MSGKSKWDYLKAIYFRYRKASKPLRSRILDEFCQICRYNRKYAIRLLNGPAPQKTNTPTSQSRRPTYGAKVIWALTAIWQAAGYPCSARLKALLPLWLPWAIKHLTLSTQVQKQLLTISPATIDRRLGVKKRHSKAPLQAHQTRYLAQTPHPHQNRLLECPESWLYRDRSGLSLRQLGFGRLSLLAQCHRHPLHVGGNPS